MHWVRVALALIVGVLLTALALWTGAYFFLGSSPGQDLLASLVPEGVTVACLRWGPAPDTVRAAGIHVAQPMLLVDARSAEAHVALPSFDVEDVTLDIARVTIDTTVPPPIVVAAPTPPTAKRPAPAIPPVRAAIDELWFQGDGVQAHLRNARVATPGGRTESADGGAGLTLALDTGPCHVAFARGRRVLGWDASTARLAVAGRGKEIDVRHFGLVRDGGLVASLSGHVSLAGAKPKAEIVADLALSRLEAEAAAGRIFPWGFEAEGIAVTFDNGIVEGKVGALHADGLAAAAVQLTDVSFALPHIAIAHGLLIPAIDADARGLYAGRVEGLGWTFEHLFFGRFTASIEKKLEGFVEAGRIGSWQIGETPLGPLELDASLVMGLAGGTIAGDLGTLHGPLEAKARLKSSPITHRTTFTTELAFARLEAPLADLLMHDLAAEERAKLGHPVAGTAELALDVEREQSDDGLVSWLADVAWDATELRGPGPDGHTPAALAWDGSAWAAVNPEAPSPEEAPDKPDKPDGPDKPQHESTP